MLLSQDGGTLTLLVAGGFGLVPGCKELERELIAWQVEPRVMEERGGGFNFCGKCLIETSGACTLGEVLSSTANSPS